LSIDEYHKKNKKEIHLPKESILDEIYNEIKEIIRIKEKKPNRDK
jgi:hypothetical protein